MNSNEDDVNVTIIGNAFDAHCVTIVINNCTANSDKCKAYKCKFCGVYQPLKDIEKHYECEHSANIAVFCPLDHSNTGHCLYRSTAHVSSFVSLFELRTVFGFSEVKALDSNFTAVNGSDLCNNVQQRCTSVPLSYVINAETFDESEKINAFEACVDCECVETKSMLTNCSMSKSRNDLSSEEVECLNSDTATTDTSNAIYDIYDEQCLFVAPNCAVNDSISEKSEKKNTTEIGIEIECVQSNDLLKSYSAINSNGNEEKRSEQINEIIEFNTSEAEDMKLNTKTVVGDSIKDHCTKIPLNYAFNTESSDKCEKRNATEAGIDIKYTPLKRRFTNYLRVIETTNGGCLKSNNCKITITNWFTNCYEVRTPYYPQVDDEVIISMSAYKNFERQLILNHPETERFELPTNILNIRRLNATVRDLKLQNSESGPFLILMTLKIEECEQLVNMWWSNTPIPDFVVLTNHYKKGDWDVGDRCRVMISEVWWLGSIAEVIDTESLFQCFRVAFDNGDNDLVSPWELHQPNPSRLPKNEKAGVRLCMHELPLLLYTPFEEDWPSSGRDAECNRIQLGIRVMLNSGVDVLFNDLCPKAVLNNFNLYTIQERLENNFYRRLNSIFFDISLLKQKFNRCHRSVLKKKRKAMIILRTIEEYISTQDCVNIIEKFQHLKDD